jgi:hypothetical protein
VSIQPGAGVGVGGVCPNVDDAAAIKAAPAAQPNLKPIKSAPDNESPFENADPPAACRAPDTIWSQGRVCVAIADRTEGFMSLAIRWRGACVAMALTVAGVGLSGCLDLVQTVSVDRTGAGRYQISATAQGFVGEALKNEKLVNKQNHAVMATTNGGGKVTRMATVDFKSLSDLAFSDETMNLTVKSRDLFGIGPSHVAFVAKVMIDKAKHENQQAQAANNVGEEVAQSILGDHTYTFTVTVPGSVEYAAPLTIGKDTFQPAVTGDYFGHTVTWKIPLYALVSSQAINFEVDFWAWGTFSNTKSQLVAND